VRAVNSLQTVEVDAERRKRPDARAVGLLVAPAKGIEGVIIPRLKPKSLEVVMAKLFKLPNGDFVDPTRVSSIEAKVRDKDEPCVIVATMDGGSIVIDESKCGKPAREARDDLAKEIDALR
jgi:hypothetical protein